MPGLVSAASFSTIASSSSGSSSFASSSSSSKLRRTSVSSTNAGGLMADMSNCKYDIVEKSLLQCGYDTVKDNDILPEGCDTHLVWMDTGVTAKTLAVSFIYTFTVGKFFMDPCFLCRCSNPGKLSITFQVSMSHEHIDMHREPVSNTCLCRNVRDLPEGLSRPELDKDATISSGRLRLLSPNNQVPR